FIAKRIGTESGLRGIFLGTIAGGLSPGGPYISLPIAAGLLRAGAGVGTIVAYLTGWSFWAFARLPMEVGIYGWKLTMIRLACTLIFPPIAGLIAHYFFPP
ncbi:MAG: permease, partial [Proteobacteria bacterium]|nr:permease [Pseudomonadota bacterium]